MKEFSLNSLNSPVSWLCANVCVHPFFFFNVRPCLSSLHCMMLVFMSYMRMTDARNMLLQRYTKTHAYLHKGRGLWVAEVTDRPGWPLVVVVWSYVSSCPQVKVSLKQSTEPQIALCTCIGEKNLNSFRHKCLPSEWSEIFILLLPLVWSAPEKKSGC